MARVMFFCEYIQLDIISIRGKLQSLAVFHVRFTFTGGDLATSLGGMSCVSGVVRDRQLLKEM